MPLATGSSAVAVIADTAVRSAKNSLLRDFCFNAIHCDLRLAASRPVNKNVSIQALL